MASPQQQQQPAPVLLRCGGGGGEAALIEAPVATLQQSPVFAHLLEATRPQSVLELPERRADWAALLRVVGEHGGSTDLGPAQALGVLALADKWGFDCVFDKLEPAIAAAASFSTAPAATGDPESIWTWLQFASRLNRTSLLAVCMRHIMQHRLVPNSVDDVAGLHAADLAELLVAFMQQHAAPRYKCLGCVGRGGATTEVRLCSACAFAPHVAV